MNKGFIKKTEFDVNYLGIAVFSYKQCSVGVCAFLKIIYIVMLFVAWIFDYI